MLKIDPKTPKGQVQLEAVAWAQTQINQVLEKFFANNYQLLRGLRVEFRLNMNPTDIEQIKVDVLFKAPKGKPEFDEAVKIATEAFEKIEKQEIIQREDLERKVN